MKSLIPDWLPKLFVKSEGSVREATTKKFSDFNKITDTEGMEVVGIKGGANVRADFPVAGEGGETGPVTTSMVGLEPDDALRNTKGQFMSTKELPELSNQKDANRFIASELQRLDQEIDGIEAGGGEVDLSDYATIEYVDETELNVLNSAIKVAQDGDKVLQDQIDTLEAPDLTGYATETYVDDSIAAIEFPEGTDLTGYATTEYVDGEIDAVMTQIPSLDGYATETYVDDAIGDIVHPEYDDSGIKKDLADETAARISGDNTLQAEITELALAVDTLLVQQESGQWKYIGVVSDGPPRNAGEFALATDDLSSDSNVIQINQTDLDSEVHGFATVVVGDYIEIVDADRPDDYVLYVVKTAPNGTGIMDIEVQLKKKGNNFLVNEVCDIRVFQINEQDLDISELDERYARKDHTHPEFAELQGDIDEITEFLGGLEMPDVEQPPEEGRPDYRRRIGWFEMYDTGEGRSASSNTFRFYGSAAGNFASCHTIGINRGMAGTDSDNGIFTEWDEICEEGEWFSMFCPAAETYSGLDQVVDVQLGEFIERVGGANGYDEFRFKIKQVSASPAVATMGGSNDKNININYRSTILNYGLTPLPFATVEQLNAGVAGAMAHADSGDAELQSQMDFMKQELNSIIPIKEEGRWNLYANYAKGNCNPKKGSSTKWGPFEELERLQWGNGFIDLDNKEFEEFLTDSNQVKSRLEIFLDKDNWGLYEVTRVSNYSSYTYWDLKHLKSEGSYKSGDKPKFEFFDNASDSPRTLQEELFGFYGYTLAKISDQINVDNLHEHPGRMIAVNRDGNIVDSIYDSKTEYFYFSPFDVHGNRPPIGLSSGVKHALKVWEIRTRVIRTRDGENVLCPCFNYTPKSWDKPFLVGHSYSQAAQRLPSIKFNTSETNAFDYAYEEVTGDPVYWRWPV